MEGNKIIAISGQPVTGKGTTVKAIKKILLEQGYSEENIHIITTGHEFRNYFNAISEFIKNYNDSEGLERLSQDPYLRMFSEKQEYRDVLIDTILKLRRKNIDTSNLSIEAANNLEEFSDLRRVVDNIIDTSIAEMGKEINAAPRPDEIWLVDSRLAFDNIPSAFSVRLTATPKVAAERLFNDNSRGKEDNTYANVQEALEAREKRRIGEQKRYLKRYGVDLENEDNYDLIIDTSFSTIEDISNTILDCLEQYRQGKAFCKKWTSPKTLLPLQEEMDTIRRGSSGKTLEEIEESIKINGLYPDVPIEVVEVDGCKYIIDGHHENFASAHLNKTLVPYEVIATDDEEVPGYGGTARQKAQSLRSKFLYGHEWFIGEKFSYTEVYPQIYQLANLNNKSVPEYR